MFELFNFLRVIAGHYQQSLIVIEYVHYIPRFSDYRLKKMLLNHFGRLMSSYGLGFDDTVFY